MSFRERSRSLLARFRAFFGGAPVDQQEFVRKLAMQYRCEVEHAFDRLSTIDEVEAYHHGMSAEQDAAPAKLYCLEVLLLKKLHRRDLVLRNAGLRDMLTHLLTDESYAALKIYFVDLKDAKTSHEDILNETLFLAARVHRRYGSVPTVERLRAQLAGAILRVLFALAIIIAILDYIAWSVNEAILFRVILTSAALIAGAMGASLSTIVRLYAIDPRHEPGNTWLSIESGKGTILIAPLLGMAFAFVLLLLFKGNLVSGDLFPNFSIGPFSDVESLHDLISVSGGGPALVGFAKLVVWGFISGWAERMVPDVLDRLAPQVKPNVKS